ncbi:hypothetical protein BsWGS_20651 [Bradybaena similaris]
MANSGKGVNLQLNKSNIRLVICADTEKGRTPYFDSKAIRLAEEENKDVIRTTPKLVQSNAFISPTQQKISGSPPKQTPKYHFQKLGSDVKVLEEMMFGTGVIAFKGLTVKVHLLRSPPQLLVSNVFTLEKLSRDSTSDMGSECSSLTGLSSDFSSKESSLKTSKDKQSISVPLDVPIKDFQSDYSTDDDNGLAYFTSSGSFRSSFPSSSSGSISSYSSLHRRWMRAHRTSLDGQHRRDSDFISEGSLSRSRRNKLAMGIIFESQNEKDEDSNELFQSFFFSHFALIEGHVEQLRSVVEKAVFNSRNFLPTVMQALETFRSDIYDLYTTPRLPEPVWLTLTSAATYKTRLCEKFLQILASLFTKYNNKKHKFFVSSLLSAVLSHHLAWVATVTPANAIQSSTYLDKHTAKWVDALTKSHPYNPLWAQLGDLYGAISFPRRISRTVVIGRKPEVVKQFLFILSYFIRCSEVRENTDIHWLTNIVNDMKFELSPSSSSSDKAVTSEWQVNCPSSVAHVSTSKQANLDNVNGFENKTNDRSEWTGLVGGDGYNSKCVIRSPASSIADSVEMHTHDSFETRYNSSNGTRLGSSCDRKLTNYIFEIGLTDEHSLGSSDYHKTVDKTLNNVLCNNYQEHSLKSNDSVILPIKSSSVGKTVDFNTSRLSSLKYPKTTISSSSAAELTGLSDLYIFAPGSSPCKLASAETLSSPVETNCHVDRADTNNIATEFLKTRGESFIKVQSANEVKIKSRLTQQLDEGIHYNGVTDNKAMSSTGSLLLHPLEVKRAMDSTSKLNFGDRVNPTGLGAAHAKNRSATPIELTRRRHLSSSGSVDYEVLDPTLHCTEVRLQTSMQENDQWHIQAFDRNFGHSLLADYTDHYLADFVLHGTSDTNYKSRLLNDLQMSVRHSVLDEPIDEAVCVIADTDNWSVEVASSNVTSVSSSGCTTWTSSQLVADLIASVVEVFKLRMSAEFCMMHLEDRLKDIYFKSVALSENMRAAASYSQQELTRVLGWDSSDLPLLLAVAVTHTPAGARQVQ